jgi:peptidoglycan/LPS O-acetylase OafA/YrhL
MIRASSAKLDLLRTVAVLCVFLNHLNACLGGLVLGSLGRFGVILFFVHTSLVLMASLHRLDGPGLREPWRLALTFGVRRVFRIYPLSMLCVVVVAAFHVPNYPGAEYFWIGFWNFCSNLALTQPLTGSPNILGVLWSLPIEIEMYCLLPFIYFLIRSGRNRSFLVWCLALAVAVAIPKTGDLVSVFAFAPCFAAGALAFDLSRSVRPVLPAWLWPCVIGIVIYLFGPCDDVKLVFKMNRAWILTLALALAIPLCRELTAPAVVRVCHWIAKYSYGIYLSHNIVFWAVLYPMGAFPLPVRIVVLVVAMVTIPIAAYHLIEEPLIRVGVKLASRLRSAEAPRPAAVSQAATPGA